MLKSLLAVAAVAAVLPAQATISVSSSAFVYSETFDSLTTSTTSVAWANDSTLPGWSLFTGPGAAITGYLGGNGSTNTGSFYSFGAASASDRALGGLASGGTYFGSPASLAVAGYIVAAFTNTSAGAYNSFTLRFAGEQWRDGGATTPSAQAMVLQYGFGSSYAGVSWAAPGGSFDYSSPVFVNTASGAAVDGNVAGRVSGLGGTISTTWAAGDTLWVRWIELNNAGNDHGLAIDDLSLSVTAVPEPGTWAMLLAGVAGVGFVARRRKG